MSEVWKWMGGEKGWWKYRVASQNAVTQQQFLLLSSSVELRPIITVEVFKFLRSRIEVSSLVRLYLTGGGMDRFSLTSRQLWSEEHRGGRVRQDCRREASDR